MYCGLYYLLEEHEVWQLNEDEFRDRLWQLSDGQRDWVDKYLRLAFPTYTHDSDDDDMSDAENGHDERDTTGLSPCATCTAAPDQAHSVLPPVGTFAKPYMSYLGRVIMATSRDDPDAVRQQLLCAFRSFTRHGIDQRSEHRIGSYQVLG